MSELFYALRYNLMGILFFGAALYFSKRGKTFWHWYVFALVVQGYSTFGTLLGMFMEPEQWRTPGNLAAVVLFFILALADLLLLYREEKRFSSKERKARIQAAVEEAKKQANK